MRSDFDNETVSLLLTNFFTYINAALPKDYIQIQEVFKKLPFEGKHELENIFYEIIPPNNEVLLKHSYYLTFSNESLPLMPAWTYQPVTYNVDSMSSLISSTLMLNIKLEKLQMKSNSQMKSDSASKILKLMEIFMLPATEYGEIFQQEHISTQIYELLQLLKRDNYPMLETTFEDESGFFKFYQNFVAQYLNTSYNNTAFGACLILPLSLRYPSDYRILFWSEMVYPMSLNCFIFDIDEYLGDEGNVQVQDLCKQYLSKVIALKNNHNVLKWISESVVTGKVDFIKSKLASMHVE